MSDNQLQKNLMADVETLKHLRLDILPAKKFYKEIVKGIGFVYLSFVCALLIACLFANSTGAWPYSKDFAVKVEQIKKDGYSRDPWDSLSSEKIEQELDKSYEKKVSELRDRERSHHQSLIINMYFGAFATPLFFMLFMMGYIKMYVIYIHQLSYHLKTGQYIKGKIWHAYMIFMGCFTLVSLLTVSIAYQDYVGVAALFSFIVSAIISTFLIDMEFTRIGISPLTSAIADYFSRDEEQLINTQ